VSRRARDHARRLVAAFGDADRQHLSDAPLPALEALGFNVRIRAESEITGPCTVAGSYQQGPPPTITVVHSRSQGRQNFTGLHELGHQLVAQDDDLQDLFAMEPAADRKFEEDVCDAIAAEFLLPDETVDRYIDELGPTARAVVELFHDRRASREACCVRAAQRIPGAGHVMLARDGVARFTAAANTQFRVRRQTPQPDDHPIVRAADRGSCRGEAPVRYSSGALSDRYFVDAVADDDYVFAVFLDSKPPWVQGLTVMSSATQDEWGNLSVTETVEASCPHCDVDFEALGAPCPTCRAYFHRGRGGCGECSCGTAASATARPPVKDAQCDSCFVRRPMGDFSTGTGTCDVCLGT
jgi:Zn-dependent peptidase ImmA (M78 family)